MPPAPFGSRPTRQEVQGSYAGFAALRSDGRVTCWGDVGVETELPSTLRVPVRPGTRRWGKGGGWDVLGTRKVGSPAKACGGNWDLP